MNTTNPSPVGVAGAFDATVANFEQDVILKSRQVPVLVDFWATWCAPCKALGPILEKLAADYGGAFLLAKVDIDREQQDFASYFQIRSVPTVMLLKDGRIAGGFPGALPESQVRRFLAEHGIEPASAAAGDTVASDPAEALARLRDAIAAAPEQPELKLDLVLALVAVGELAEADALLESLPANLGADARAAKARSRISFGRLLDDAPPRAALEARLGADPDDLAAQHLLGVRLILAGEAAAGLEVLLGLLRKNRDYADGLPRRTLVDAFNVIDDEALVRACRRRMTALLY